MRERSSRAALLEKFSMRSPYFFFEDIVGFLN
jgi:hypothetical protein